MQLLLESNSSFVISPVMYFLFPSFSKINNVNNITSSFRLSINAYCRSYANILKKNLFFDGRRRNDFLQDLLLDLSHYDYLNFQLQHQQDFRDHCVSQSLFFLQVMMAKSACHMSL